MNQYLFLYPIKEYFEAEIKDSLFSLDGHNVGELFTIINARYRDRNYQINWLLFSEDGNARKPDFSIVSAYVDIHREDRILLAGISFVEHIGMKVYTDEDFVLNQLLAHRKLVLGGFHQFDCVDRIARRSYERGIDTFVDEDTTHMFFNRHALTGIPLIRERWSLRNLLGVPYSEELYIEILENRKNKPWLTQV